MQAYYTRPYKKPRTALAEQQQQLVHNDDNNNGAASMIITTTSSSMCVLRPFLQKLGSSASPSPFSTANNNNNNNHHLLIMMENIISLLHATKLRFIDPESSKRLHGMLLLHLGYYAMSSSAVASSASSSSLICGYSRGETLGNHATTPPTTTPPTLPTSTTENNKTQEWISILLHCLRVLYEHVNATTTHQSLSFVGQGDLKESFCLLLQILRLYSRQECSNKSSGSGSSSTAEDTSNRARNNIITKQTVRMACWQVLDLLLHTTTTTSTTTMEAILDENPVQMEQLIMMILQCMGEDDDNGNGDSKQQQQQRQQRPIIKKERDLAYAILCKLERPTCGHRTMHRAKIAMAAVSNRVVPIMMIDDQHLPSQLLAPAIQSQDRLFYWKCLAHCVDGSSSFLALANDNHVLQGLLEMIEANGNSATQQPSKLALDATECLCLFAEKCQPTQDCSRLVQSLVTAMLLDSQQHSETGGISRIALPGLMALIERTEGMNAFLNMQQLNKIMNSLSAIALHEDNLEVQIQAAKIVTKSIDSMVTCSYWKREGDLRHSLSTVASLLSSDNDAIVIGAVDLVGQLFDTKKWRRQTIASYPDLVSALAMVASNDFTTPSTRHKTITAFWNLIRDDNQHVSFVARQPNVLEAIVQVASIRTPTTAVTRKLALSVILRLSTNACNRRALAKQAGLLPVLIRYARTMPASTITDEAEDDILVPRELLKKQILLLATAL
jgi:hypothetical protein